MTPQGLIGNSQTSAPTAPNLYNQVSSMGMAGKEQEETSDQQPQGESLVDKATKRFGSVFNMFVQLTESYPGADKESQTVKDSMANWLNAIANRINESQGNSNY